MCTSDSRLMRSSAHACVTTRSSEIARRCVDSCALPVCPDACVMCCSWRRSRSCRSCLAVTSTARARMCCTTGPVGSPSVARRLLGRTRCYSAWRSRRAQRLLLRPTLQQPGGCARRRSALHQRSVLCRLSSVACCDTEAEPAAHVWTRLRLPWRVALRVSLAVGLEAEAA